MATIVLKDLPSDLYRRLEERARQHGRTVEREVIDCLEGVVEARPRHAAELQEELGRLRALRERVAAETGLFVTDAEIDEAKRLGRP